jgi:SpoIID/LytB domain protein
VATGAAPAPLQPAAGAPGAAYFIRSLSSPSERREARPGVLDRPVLPGSVVKALTLVTALESGVVTPEGGTMCRRVVTVDGVRFTCAHPDLKRPLTPAEALAYSCNDFFVSLAPRLTREQVNRTRLAAGLPPIVPGTPIGPALVGLAGPRSSPRALIDVLARLMAVGPDPAVPMTPSTRAVLRDGLAGAATYGTASALGERGLSAFAKTGTAPMPGGGVAGVVIALTPAPNPTHGIVVVAPGAAGLDAASMAADLLGARDRPRASPAPTPTPPGAADAASFVTPLAPATIRLGRTLGSGRTRVESLAVDDYIAQVLAGEGQPGAGEAAQQALAITARTFALANRGRHGREGFDLCDTTHCQVVRPATAGSRRAAAATSGRVLLASGQPASVFYSAWCGGRLERASQVWPGAIDHRHPERDDACSGEPPWTSDVRAGDVERALRAAGLRGGRLRALRVVQRNPSGRVERLHAEGLTPPHVSGHDFRMAMGRIVGWQTVKSTAFEVQRTGSGYRFRGTGFGHGVGLCVIGAGVRAGRGETAAAILGFYFPDLTIGHVSAPAATTVGSASASSSRLTASPATAPATAAPAPAAAPTGDVQLGLPLAGESERPVILALVRRARDDIARAAGLRPPALLRLTVHPTVESFGRATGQPWWSAGATSGTTIHLLPTALLRQRGVLEQTVRHEVAHVLLDAELSSRPLWVREGAAIVFGSEAGVTGPAGAEVSRVTCPGDDEIRRPVSAGAQRDAYARAEACFRRALAGGRSWREIR